MSALPFATHDLPLGETMGAHDAFADAPKTHTLKVVLTAEPVGGKPASAREEALAGAV
ncbi:MAG TPA: hypothetical protein VIL98_14815 [Gaiellaceae bacterium]